MNKINTKELAEESWSSPKGKFAGAGKEVSEALGRNPRSTDLMERHPFDVEIDGLVACNGDGPAQGLAGGMVVRRRFFPKARHRFLQDFLGFVVVPEDLDGQGIEHRCEAIVEQHRNETGTPEIRSASALSYASAT